LQRINIIIIIFMYSKNLLFYVFVIGFTFYYQFSHAQNKNLKPTEELGIYEHLDQKVDGNLTFKDENGNLVTLSSLIKKPTVINLVYYECPGICTPLINGLSDVIKQADMVLGTQYKIVTISFDPEEGSDLARKKKNTYLKINSSDDVEHGWTFLSGDSANINQLLNQLGFKVKKEGQEYVHPAALIMVSPDLKITRYLNGVYFNPFDFKLALIEASQGKSGPTINKVLDYCFSYDPQGKRYVFSITKVAGTFVVLFALILLGFMIRIELKRRKQNQNNSNPIQ